MKLNHLAKLCYALIRPSEALGKCKSTTIWRIMKLILFFTLTFTLQVSADVLAQRVSLSAKNQSLKQVLKELRKQSRYSFMYSDSDLQAIKTVNLTVHEKELLEVLPLLFEDLPLTYTVNGKIISIRKKKDFNPQNHKIEVEQYEDLQTKDWIIEGRVLDAETGKPVEEVVIESLDASIVTKTDQNGRFRIVILGRKGGDE